MKIKNNALENQNRRFIEELEKYKDSISIYCNNNENKNLSLTKLNSNDSLDIIPELKTKAYNSEIKKSSINNKISKKYNSLAIEKSKAKKDSNKLKEEE